jgi:hypothetical protein
MMSVEEQNRTAANQLLDTAMRYARRVLRNYGEIGPFAFSMQVDGSISRETLENPRLPADPASLWKFLHAHVSQLAHRGEIKAAAVAASISLAQPSQEGYSDAILFQIEIRSGYANKVTVPYRIYGGPLWPILPRRVAQGSVTAQEMAPTIFTTSPHPSSFR